MSTSTVLGVILCGGHARRMDGVDKPLQLLDGATLVAHVFQRLAPQVAGVVISANRNTERYAELGVPVLHDSIDDAGPLAGILAAVEAPHVPSATHLFVCPGDAPLLDESLVGSLSAAMTRSGAQVAVPHDGTRLQPLFALLSREVAASIRDYLEFGDRTVRGWLDLQHIVTVDASPIASSFLNINTRQELLDASRVPSMHDPIHLREEHS